MWCGFEGAEAVDIYSNNKLLFSAICDMQAGDARPHRCALCLRPSRRSKRRMNLDVCRYLCLDEADRMVDLG